MDELALLAKEKQELYYGDDKQLDLDDVQFYMGDDGESNILISSEVDFDLIIALSSEFIPDTVLKTTPQTLSDTDKNQALANLGIDPIVWKYMCAPLPINDQDNCPEELLDERGNLKYQIPSMYIVHRGGKYCGPVSWVGERDMSTFYNNGSYFEVNLDDSGVFTITQMTAE